MATPRDAAPHATVTAAITATIAMVVEVLVIRRA
jgi:hypothetical protein